MQASPCAGGGGGTRSLAPQPDALSPLCTCPVDNQAMLHYIRDKTAVPYFSNLVWFIGSHVIELDNCVQTDEE